MYQAEDLAFHPYFASMLEQHPLASMLDSLTGALSRASVQGFIRALIDRGEAFTLGMVDLDSFKAVNDNYGHSTGDRVLITVASGLARYLDGRGVVGRFGGDEFIIVALIGNDYDRVHDFYAEMYSQGLTENSRAVFRRNVIDGQRKIFVSATVGSACFPKDAGDYDTLFSLVDKALYRGKFKGRNCYIIYVAEKHAHLEIPKLAHHRLFDTFMLMANGFDSETDLRDRLFRAFDGMRQHINLQFLFRVFPDGTIMDVEKNEICGTCEDLSPLTAEDGSFACSSRRDVLAYPRLLALMERYAVHSVLILTIGRREARSGFLVLSPEPHTQHIWQDEEFAAGFVLVRMLWDFLQHAEEGSR